MPIQFGGVVQRVVKNSIRQLEPVYQGTKGRNADGSAWNTERDGKRRYTFQIVWRTPAEESSLRAACPRGQRLSIDWPEGDTGDGFVEIGDGDWIVTNFVASGFTYNNAGDGFYKKVVVRVEEA